MNAQDQHSLVKFVEDVAHKEPSARKKCLEEFANSHFYGVADTAIFINRLERAGKDFDNSVRLVKADLTDIQSERIQQPWPSRGIRRSAEQAAGSMFRHEQLSNAPGGEVICVDCRNRFHRQCLAKWEIQLEIEKRNWSLLATSLCLAMILLVLTKLKGLAS